MFAACQSGWLSTSHHQERNSTELTPCWLGAKSTILVCEKQHIYPLCCTELRMWEDAPKQRQTEEWKPEKDSAGGKELGHHSHIAGNIVVNCGPWERLAKDRLNSVSESELLAFLLNPVPSAMSPSQVMATPSFYSLRSKTKESFWTPPLLGSPPPVHNLLLTVSTAVTLVAATFISHPNYCKVSNMTSLLPPYPLPAWQSSLNTTARVILIKENHIMSFFCSKLSGDFHFIQDKSQSPLNNLHDLCPCSLLLPLPPHTPPLSPSLIQLHWSACQSLNTGDTFQP